MSDSNTTITAIKTRQDYFMSLLNPYHDKLVRYVHAMTRNTEDARDIIGETILVAFEQMDNLRDHEAFPFYIFKIARRQFFKLIRRRKLFIGYNHTHEDLQCDTSIAPDVLPDVSILNHAIQKLPTKHREALVLFELSGFSLEEIRLIQGGSISGVKSRVTRARQKLTKLLCIESNTKAENTKPSMMMNENMLSAGETEL